jgi:hypothetical protein
VGCDVKDRRVLRGCYREEGNVTRENKALPASGFVVLWKCEGPVHTDLVGPTLVLNSSRRVIYVHRTCTEKKYIQTTQQTAIYSHCTN